MPLNTGVQNPTTVSSSHTDTTVRVLYKIALARLNGKVLTVKVTGPKGNAMLAISALTKSKTISTTIRTVPANKKVKLKLRLTGHVQKLRLSVLPG